jgi:TolB-like protein/Tfp pilus assembly protein PilF
MAYGAASWGFLQGLDYVGDAFGWPDELRRIAILALLTGWPIVLVIAWFHGDRGAQRVSFAEFAIISALFVLGGGIFRAYEPAAHRAAVEIASPAAGDLARAPDVNVPPKSVAVLAFADLSPAQDQAYLAEGIAEEILNALARVADLRVAGRSSAFHFKDRGEDARSIGRALGVAHLLEGSVRKHGERVRITAKLVRSGDGFHLWSETFDGNLRDVFDLQERIARAVAERLQAVLDAGQQARLVPVATGSADAYALFLQATAIYNRRDPTRFREAIAQLERAVAIDPHFARAYARLAAVYSIAPDYGQLRLADAVAATEWAAGQATRLDPTLGEPHAALGQAYATQRRHREARAELERALELEPNDVTSNYWYGTTLVTSGYLERANVYFDRALARDPMHAAALVWRASNHSTAGEHDAAAILLQRAADAGLVFVGLGQSLIAEQMGDRAEASRLLAEGVRAFLQELPEDTAELFARGAYGDAAASAETLRRVDAYLATRPPVVLGVVPYVLMRLGEPLRALALAEAAPLTNPIFTSEIWGPYGRELRALPQFAGYAQQTGLTAVWDAEGPPDLCSRTGAGAYACR